MAQSAFNKPSFIYKPDLILLNIKMPEMDGYEVCKRLKANEQTFDIPVIFLSVFNDNISKINAFAVGGAAYIVLPFLIEELLASVKNHIVLKRLQEENIQLRQINETKSKLFGVLAQNFKNQVMGILTAVELLEKLAKEGIFNKT